MATTRTSTISPISPISSLSSRSRRALLAAHRLRHLTTSLTISWDSLGEGAREALVREIQLAADDLGSIADPWAPGPHRGADTDPLRFLTPRERQVLDGLAAGASTPDLAARLGLSTSTVRSYVKAVLSKLGVHSRLEAVVLLLESGKAEERAPAGRGSERRHG
jgi:DNA-binding NarL/FixJ family response regulator